MPSESNDIRNKTRALKVKVIAIAMAVLEDPKHPLYNETYLATLKNTVPRTQEITGEDGEAINIQVVNYANPQAPIPTSGVSDTIITSV